MNSLSSLHHTIMSRQRVLTTRRDLFTAILAIQVDGTFRDVPQCGQLRQRASPLRTGVNPRQR